MHLIVPFASAVSPAGRQAMESLVLPQLQRLLSGMQSVQTGGSDEFSLSAPHELALAAAHAWPLNDGAIPFASALAREAGLDTHAAAWALLTPVHLHLGTDQVTLTDPADLQLDAADSRVLFDAIHPLFDSEGFDLHWRARDQWLATHAVFDSLATASLDRVIGRNIDRWLPDAPQARLLRRLQNEVQMLLYTHPMNDRREAAGVPTVNSVWYSGSGSGQVIAATAADEHLTDLSHGTTVVDDRLRRPALGEDWAAWCEAWRALDAGPIAELLRQPGAIQLSLCGERRFMRFEPNARSWSQRLAQAWRRPAIHTVLEAL